jgi:hypothetical protein
MVLSWDRERILIDLSGLDLTCVNRGRCVPAYLCVGRYISSGREDRQLRIVIRIYRHADRRIFASLRARATSPHREQISPFGAASRPLRGAVRRFPARLVRGAGSVQDAKRRHVRNHRGCDGDAPRGGLIRGTRWPGVLA